MRLGIISDIHLEFWKATDDYTSLIENINAADADVIVCAGDFYNGSRYNNTTLNKFISDVDKKMYFCYGNHDYYHGKFTSDMFHVPPADENFPNGAFFGTLWTNFWNNPASAVIAQGGVSDFRLIESEEEPGKAVRPHEMSQVQASHITAIQTLPCDIVVTHFPPSTKSVSPKYAGNPYNPYFVNDFGPVFFDDKKLWIHGHVHSDHDYMIGDCRVVCHPLGYPYEGYKFCREYHPLIVEI